MVEAPPSRALLGIAALLVVAVGVVYSGCAGNQFVNLDDYEYVVKNPHVTGGFTVASIRWAFTAFHAANWHPLTWLSHMLDVRLFGMNPAGHHVVNVFFHAVNTVLLFLFLARTTGALWRSAVVAALFALHPLHVESVAWVSERKDLLSSCLLLVGLLIYASYVRRPGWLRYLGVLVTFACGLMAKPMLVTFPFILLLLDYWPFGRLSPEGEGRFKRRVLLEKIPFCVLSGISSIITIQAQRDYALVSLEDASLPARVANAALSYVRYMGKMFWPVDLAAFYPLPASIPPLYALVSGTLLLAITYVAVRFRRRFPYLAVGWFWYLGMLVPVIGLVQVGLQSMADRYTYMSLTGLFIVLVWGSADLLSPLSGMKKALVSATAAVTLTVLSIATWTQVANWKNSLTLFSRTVAKTSGNWFALTSLGMELDAQGRYDEAFRCFQEALQLNPKWDRAHFGMGIQLARLGRMDEAMAHYRRAVEISPDFPEAVNNLANALVARGAYDEALGVLSRAVSLAPDNPVLQYDLGTALEAAGRPGEAVPHYRRALEDNPNYAAAHNNLGFIRLQQGDLGQAIYHLSEAVRLNPRLDVARETLRSLPPQDASLPSR